MIDDATIQTLKDKYGDELHMLTLDIGDADAPQPLAFVTRSPGAEYKRFRAMVLDENQRAQAIETLARACIVYPDAVTLTALLSRKPAVFDKLGGAVAKLAGTEAEVTVKKL
jgi:hypothetical protein